MTQKYVSASLLTVSILVFLFGTIGAFLLDTPGATRDHVVQMECGGLEGSYDGRAYTYLGIPYAESPIGDLRFQPPVDISKDNHNCWHGRHREAKQPSAFCVQWWDDETDIRGAEDCLYLNVWSPTKNASAGLPVMVWVHGGNLEHGSGYDENYRPSEELARDTNVVYVSMNYRLGPLGFMALDILSRNSSTNTSGNYGFMDIISALRWTQRNIQYFGGDPSQVTLFGQSGGGTAVLAVVISPLSAGLISKAWIMSGSPIMATSLAQASVDNLSFLKNTGCSDVECLLGRLPENITKSVNWNTFPDWNQNPQYDLPHRGDHDGSLPVIDGHVIMDTPTASFQHLPFTDIPLMIGTMAQDLDWTMPGDGSWPDYERFVHSFLDSFSVDVANMALRLYPSGVETPEYQYSTMTTDIRVGCGHDILAMYAGLNHNSSAYRYVATSRPSSMNYGGSPYSFHGWDITAFFGFLNDLEDHPTEDDYMFQMSLRQEILSFVRTGHPRSSEWKSFPQNMAVFSDKVSIEKSYHAYECSFWNMQGFYNYTWTN